jgi:hypothetical protein
MTEMSLGKSGLAMAGNVAARAGEEWADTERQARPTPRFRSKTTITDRFKSHVRRCFDDAEMSAVVSGAAFSIVRDRCTWPSVDCGEWEQRLRGYHGPVDPTEPFAPDEWVGCAPYCELPPWCTHCNTKRASFDPSERAIDLLPWEIFSPLWDESDPEYLQARQGLEALWQRTELCSGCANAARQICDRWRELDQMRIDITSIKAGPERWTQRVKALYLRSEYEST